MIVRPNSGVMVEFWNSTPSYSVTGSGPVLGDNDDGSWVDVATSDYGSSIAATFPATAAAATLPDTAIPRTVFVRCSSTGIATIGYRLDNVNTGEMFSQYGAGFAVPSTPTTLEIQSDAANGDPRPAFAAGELAVALFRVSGTGVIRIYDAWIVLPDSGPVGQQIGDRRAFRPFG